MLSKWLFVSLLVLGVQDSFSLINIGNYIPDLSKFTKVFYDPNTRVALKGALEKVGREPFPGIGFRGIKCNCEGLTCGCCSGINITKLNFDQRACTNFTYSPEDFAIKAKFILNEKEIVTATISGKNPAPFCMPVYPPFLSFCVRFFDIYQSGQNLHTCIDLETRVVAWPVLVLHFDCIKVGADGISVIKPGDNNTVTLAELAAIMPEVNGPEIYDQVDFEPDSVEFPNSHTSSITPEKEDNIGQLKL